MRAVTEYQVPVERLEMIPRVCGKVKNHWYHLSDLKLIKDISLEGEIMSLAFMKKE